MKPPWFKRAGWIYWPIALPGFVATLLFLAFAVQLFVAVDRKSHSASDTLHGVFPFWACGFLLLDWLGNRTAAKPGN